MRLPGRAPLIGAYVSPRGVVAIECRRSSGGFEIGRVFDVPLALKSPGEAADHAVSVLQSAGVVGAHVSVAMRGFGVAHQTLQFPPASDEILGPIIEREVRRLEPHLTDCVVNWLAQPPLDPAGANAPTQRAFLATAAPAETVQALDNALRTAGHHLSHLTALPVAIQRVLDQFDSGTGAIVTIASLPDGGYIGFSLNGGVRLIVEPPLPQDAEHEAAALGEEVELATMFVRQQFRGANIDRIVLVGVKESLVDLKAQLADRMKVPAKQLEAEGLGPAGFVALGAVLDGQAADAQSIGGTSRLRARTRPQSRLEMASYAALLVLALAGLWTIGETARTVMAKSRLRTAQQRVEQDAFGLAPVRATADQRRLVRDAIAAVQVVTADRVGLQETLAGIAAVVRPPARLDSLRLSRDDAGWRATLGGVVESSTNARAVQSVHDLYRELPQRIRLDSLRLDKLTYADESASESAPIVRFQLSFRVARQRGN